LLIIREDERGWCGLVSAKLIELDEINLELAHSRAETLVEENAYYLKIQEMEGL
jgi:hypothetical protein